MCDNAAAAAAAGFDWSRVKLPFSREEGGRKGTFVQLLLQFIKRFVVLFFIAVQIGPFLRPFYARSIGHKCNGDTTAT